MGARQIYEALRDQILGRVYGAGGLLPSSRALAGELGVSRGTVTIAYEQLAGGRLHRDPPWRTTARCTSCCREGARARDVAAIVTEGATVGLR